jgi:hypothetical protein
MKKITTTILLAAIAAGMFFAGRGCGPNNRNADGAFDQTETRVDTVFIRDTLRETVFVPVERRIVRVDTVFLKTPGDTVRVETLVPIERKVYATGDYRAVVEGFGPALVEMEIYRQNSLITREITRTLKPRRWAAGIQAGYGLTPRGPSPYIGVGVQYTVLSR